MCHVGGRGVSYSREAVPVLTAIWEAASLSLVDATENTHSNDPTCNIKAILLGVGTVGTVFLKLVMEGFQADAEKFGGAHFVVSRDAERLENEFALHDIHRGADRKLDGRQIAWPLCGYFAEFGREASAGDEVLVAHDGGALEGITQFADVAGPGVAHENVHHF